MALEGSASTSTDSLKRFRESDLIIDDKPPVKKLYGTAEDEIYNLGHSKILKVCRFNNQKRVDLRIWEEGKPTKKGVSLTVTEVKELINHLDEVMSEFSALRESGEGQNKIFPIGRSVYFSFDAAFGCVSIRRHFTPPNTTTILPTRFGVSLGFEKFCRLSEILRQINLCEHSDVISLVSCGSCLPQAWSEN